MAKLIINNHAEFGQYLGQVMGESEWHKINQEQINRFADATLDHQWIHIDEERAKKGPFGTTIAHGYLTLSLVPYLWDQITQFNNVKMLVNYGMDRLKFGQAVKVNDDVKLKATLKSLANLRGISKAEVDALLEIKGEKKPAFTATIIFLYHFE
ncbi:MAG: MaoC family dehydratase [Ekhidna sp.]|nr:MaoC family dehydratase [Ekhidna sp.]MBC6408884.1 MaoC family dehydratase [Ekhidna sp.]